MTLILTSAILFNTDSTKPNHKNINHIKVLKMQFQITFLLVLMQIAAGDLIGWNRTRNTAHKHMLVRNKIGNSAILDQYRQFYKIQKLKSAVVRNIRKRSAVQPEDEPIEKPTHQSKSGRLNRLKKFRNFHH